MPLTVEQFTDPADALIKQLKLDKPDLIVSDVLDDEGHQYVNLVQKGGGVLGIALVGYTYVLEQMGIRFLRLAGTSAGAINTALMTITGDKTTAKSKRILEIMIQIDFNKFMDGKTPIAWLLKQFVKTSAFSKRILHLVYGIFIFPVVLFFISIVLYFLSNPYPCLAPYAYWSIVFLTGCSVLFVLGILYAASMAKRFNRSGFGINPGNYFYDWMEAQFNQFGIHTSADFDREARKVPVFRNRIYHPSGTQGLDGDVTIIAAEVATQNKIQFPLMSDLFTLEPGKISPAAYVRASMSIPFFFESYYIAGIPCKSPYIQDKWRAFFNENDPPSKARFVDGGILSNFPMSIFYKPDIRTPRMPNFGIELDDSDPKDNEKDSSTWSLGGFVMRIFNTARYYYDKDFLLRNKLYTMGIGTVKLFGFNWLKFSLPDSEKKALFAKGVEAACEFIRNKYEWEKYKTLREEYHDERNNPMGTTK